MQITMLKFKPITLAEEQLIRQFTADNQEGSCENSFVNMLIWQTVYENTWATAEGQLIFKSGGGKDMTFSLPFGDNFLKGIDLIRKYSGKEYPPFWLQEGERMKRFCEYMGDCYEITESRDDFDYLYEQTALAELSGKKYHAKRNHIASFSKKVSWQYRPLTDENADEISRCAEEWYQENHAENNPRLQAERQGIDTMLTHRTRLGVKGGAIVVNGRIVAFTLGTALNDRVFDIHIEKALSDFAEAYTVINHEFAKTLTDFQYINREDDMGLEGLRRSKLSYHPAFLLKKYVAVARKSV